MKHFSFAAVLFFLASGSLQAQTPLPAGIYADTTLTLAQSPYRMTTDLVVFSGATLTLEPGVEIRADSSVRLEVRGKLVARGTASQKIRFTSNTPVGRKGFWRGIVFSGPLPVFEHCAVSHAYEGISPYWADMSQRAVFRNCLFTQNAYGAHNLRGPVLFDSCEFRSNGYGVTGTGYIGKSCIKNCLFDANEWGSEGADTVLNCEFKGHTIRALRPYGYTAYCYIHDNELGIYGQFNDVNHTFINNRVVNNKKGVNIGSYRNGQTLFSGNTFCGNTDFDVALEKGSTGNINIPGNCWCAADSTAIRTGVLDGYKDVSRGLIQFVPTSSSCPTGPLSAATPAPRKIDVVATPNPVAANGVLTVKWGALSGTDVRCTVTDLSGRLVPYQVVRSGSDFRSLQLNAAPGVYLVTLAAAAFEGGSRTERVVVE